MTFFEKLGRLAPWNKPDAAVAERPEPVTGRLAPPVSAPPRASAPKSEPFPRFRANANDHVNPLAIDAHARARMKLLEAFTPSQPVGDRKRFAGRTEILTQLIRAIEEQRLHTVLYGSRGLGKTSVLHVLAQAAREIDHDVPVMARLARRLDGGGDVRDATLGIGNRAVFFTPPGRRQRSSIA